MNGNTAGAGPRRVIHFVTGGGSGATKAALDIACEHLRRGGFVPLLVLRRKPAPLPAPMAAQIVRVGLQSAWVDSGWKVRTRHQLRAIIADFKPDVFVAHGNSEHLWGRQAALAAGVRAVVHVEHCNERYLFWRRWTAQRLAAATTATVCVSQSVADFARQHRLLSPVVRVIPNSTDVLRFASGAPDLAARAPDIVMMARFARQKDQATLIRAVPRLIASGWTGRLLLAGGGQPGHRRRCEQLARRLGVAPRVDFLGAVGDPAALYHRCRVAVLSTHYEGMPLALIESMAAGCASVGSAVPGVIDVIRDRETGWLFPARDEAALADVIQEIIAGGPAVAAVVARGVAVAADSFSPEKQIDRYESLFRELLSG